MDKLIFGLLVAVIGLLTVFFGLTVLIMLIKSMTALTGRNGKKKAETPAPASEPVAEITEEETDDGEVIAAITAAISCMMEEGSRFTVRHVRRIGAR